MAARTSALNDSPAKRILSSPATVRTIISGKRFYMVADFAPFASYASKIRFRLLHVPCGKSNLHNSP